MSQLSLFDTPSRPNRLIEAGAGTGKTTRLVTDVLRLLLDDPELDASRIVLMTFTEKAAGEIASRIRAAVVQFREILEGGGDSWPDASAPIIRIAPGQLARARRAAMRHSMTLDAIRSQTIHSFCQSLLRQYPLEAGLDPRFTIVETVARNRLLNDCFGEWVERELNDPDDETTLLWTDALSLGRGMDHLRTAVSALHARRDIIESERYSIGSVRDLERWVRLRLEAISEVEDHIVEAKGNADLRQLVTLAREDPPLDTDAAWDELMERINALGSLHANSVPGARERKTAWKELKGVAKDRWVVNHRAAEAYRRLSSRFFQALDAKKRELGVLDFDDLLERTDTLLANDAIAEMIRQRYDYIFVDEFQDTDRVQARILDTLARDRNGALIPGRVTIVGDPKQSIYSFRRAEPEIFHQVVERYSREGSARESLPTQYRSDPPLLEAVNAMFTSLFGDGARLGSVVQPGYAPLHAGRGALRRNPTARLRFLGIECAAGEQAIRAEAEGVAEWILQHRDRREKGADGDLRRFAILLRKMTSAAVWADVFSRRGIELALPPAAELLSQRGSTDLLAVLRAVADPLDRAAAFAAARSLFFALRDDEIAAAMTGAESEHWSQMQETMRRWRRTARAGGAARLIDAILQESGVETSLLLVHGGDRWLARMMRIRELGAELDQSGASLREFVRELLQRRAESAESEPARPEDNVNAVRLMTVHAAKGLEFDTVILAELGARTQGGSTNAFTIEEQNALVMESPSSINRFIATIDGTSYKELQARRREWERDRLFYVAVTRARTDVVFVAAINASEDAEGEESFGSEANTEFWKPISTIFGFIRKELDGRMPQALSEEVETLQIGGSAIDVAFERLRPAAGDDQRVRFTRGFDPSRLEVGEVPTLPAAPDGLDRGEIARRRASARRRGWGTAVHRALELWTPAAAPDALAQRAGAEQALLQHDVDALTRILGSLDTSATWRRIQEGTLIARELSVLTPSPLGATTGRIDLLLRDADGVLLVVDYKTGQASADRIATDSGQVRGYCRNVSAMTGETCNGLLWYLEDDRAVEVAQDELVSGP